MAEAVAESFEDLTRGLRGSLASLRAAAETLEQFPQMDEAQQKRLRAVISGEALRLGQLVDKLERLGDPGNSSNGRRSRVSGAELAAALAARVEARQDGELGGGDGGQEAWLELELEAVVEAAAELLGRLRRELGVGELSLRQRVAQGHAICDFLWQAEAPSLDRLRLWQSEALDQKEDSSPGLRPIVRRHGGEAWFNLDREASSAYLRLLLPLADTGR
jgi:DNA polymerase III subunit epsilon